MSANLTKSEKIDKKFFFTIKFSEDYNPSDISWMRGDVIYESPYFKNFLISSSLESELIDLLLIENRILG